MASRGKLEKSIRLREGVEYLIRDGQPEPQSERTLPAKPDWGDTEQVIFQLSFDKPDSIRESLSHGTVAEHDSRPVLETEPIDDERQSKVVYAHDDAALFSLTQDMAIRFRYFFTDEPSGTFTLKLHNRMRDTTYSYTLVAPQSRQWLKTEAQPTPAGP